MRNTKVSFSSESQIPFGGFCGFLSNIKILSVVTIFVLSAGPTVSWARDGDRTLLVTASSESAATAINDLPVPSVVSPLRFDPHALRQGINILAQADVQSGQGQKADRVDALISDDPAAGESATTLNGFYQLEAAYTIPSPAHGSKFLNRLDVFTQGKFSENVKWKVGGRVNYDAIFDLNNFYPKQVRDDQRFEAMLRENYLDISQGNLEFRVGRQHIVWGEVIGLFFADVVSAKDLREFVLPDFDLLRIPQWAVRAEYFKEDFHAEAIWIPVPSVDKIGKPGAEFYPFSPAAVPGVSTIINDEQRPDQNRSNQNYGIRLSNLANGWDVAGFAYHSVDSSPTFFREIVTTPTPAIVYTPKHEKINQFGMTVAKDFRDVVMKGEAVYTRGRNFNVTRLSDDDGVVHQNYLDYILSLEFPLPAEARFTFEFFQRRFANHDPDILVDKYENGLALQLSGKVRDRIELQLLIVNSLNRNDYVVRPKIVWNFEKNWRMVAGADFFHGPATGLFGQFDKKDRGYAEVRRSF